MQILFLQKCITNMQNPISRQHCRHIVHSIVKSNPLHNLKSSFEIIRHIFRWSCWDNLRRLPFRWASGITTKSILVKCSLFFGYYRTAVFSLCTLIGAVYRAAVFLLVYISSIKHNLSLVSFSINCLFICSTREIKKVLLVKTVEGFLAQSPSGFLSVQAPAACM